MSIPSDRIHGLLTEIKRIAAEGSLTGTLKRGARTMAQIYNRCLDSIEEHEDGEIKAVFPELDPEIVTLDEVGVAAALLAAFLRPRPSERSLREEEDE